MNDFLINENNSKSIFTKNAKKAIATSWITIILMLVLQLAASFFINFSDDEVIYLFQSIALYFFYIGVPAIVAKLIFTRCIKNPPSVTKKRFAPKKPVLYILGALGMGYLINITFNLIFQKFVEKYSVDAVTAPETPFAVVLMFIQMAIIPPLFEEWAFRGVILKHLLPYGKWSAIFISSLLFGLAHVDLPRIIFATCFGLLLGICYEYTNSLAVPMFIHFLNNFIATIITIYVDNELIVAIAGLFMMALMVVGVVAVIYYAKYGLAKKNITLIKPSSIGYKLSLGKSLQAFITSPAIIPFAALFAVFLYLIYG